MTEPIFWLVCSFFLVAVCLTAVLVVAIPAFREFGRASRSAEKLFDALYRDLPPTLDAIRRTGTELNHLTDDLNTGIEHASSVVQQVDQSMRQAKHQAQELNITTRSLLAGMTAAWNSFFAAPQRRDRRNRSIETLTTTPPETESSDNPKQQRAIDYETQWETEQKPALHHPSASQQLSNINPPPDQD